MPTGIYKHNKHSDVFIICLACKKEFVVSFNARGRKFCSKHCSNGYGGHQKISIICLYCKKEFVIPFNQRYRKFCSTDCAHRYNNKKRYKNPEERQKNILRVKKYWEDPESHKKAKESAKKRWENPEQHILAGISQKLRFEDLKERENISLKTKEAMKDPELLKKISQRSKEKWKDPSYRERGSRVMKELWKNPEFANKILDKFHKWCKPNKKETALDTKIQNDIPGQWKYVGNGDIWIARKNPDYLNVNGKKQVIELLGCFWHGCKIHCPDSKYKDDSKELVTHYKKYGFDCLIIWEHELKDMDIVLEKIKKF